MSDVSEWISKNLHYIKPESSVLDLACGQGRHSLLMADHGLKVTAVDKDVSVLKSLNIPKITTLQADLEENLWPFEVDQFDAIIVTNYLWRPLFPNIIASLRPGGYVLYETFAVGNEKYGRPSNPDFLLAKGELPDLLSELEVVDYFHGKREIPKPAIKQAVIARRV